MRILPLLAAFLVATPAFAQAPDQWHAQARAMLDHLVSVRSSEGHHNVPALDDYLARRFVAAGVPASAIVRLPLGETEAMMVRIAGRNRAAKPILMSAHLDVVDADPKDWTRDPFKLVEENGYFYGRGVADDKTSAAQLAITIERLAREHKTPSRDLIFAFIGDEETTEATTAMLAGPKKALIDAEYEIEFDGNDGLYGPDSKPVIYLISAAEKTYSDYALTVTNPGGHSSLPRADNAIYELADALGKVRAYQFPPEANAITRSELAAAGKVTPGPLGGAMRAFAANPADAAAAARLSAVPAYVGLVRTTCVATMVNAGHAANALPQSATANVNCRIFPGTSPEQVRARLQTIVGRGVTVAKTGAGGEESPVSPPRPDIEAAIARAVHAYAPGVPVAYAQPAGASDAAWFRRAGIPSYGSSGMFLRDEDDFMHGLNERLTVKAFYDSIDYAWALVGELANPK